MYSNNSLHNHSPLLENTNTLALHGHGGNNTTLRGNEIPEFLPTSKHVSRNMAESSFKVLRFYRKVCRMLPFLLRIHGLTVSLTATQAMLSVGNTIKENAHLREPSLVDYKVYRGYEHLQQAEWHYCTHRQVHQLLTKGLTPGEKGYSYLENQKMQGKSNFLRGFYKGSNPADF